MTTLHIQPKTTKTARTPLRVLLISHTCQVPAEGQPKAEFIAQSPDIQLQVLIPDRWCHYGKYRQATLTPNARADYKVEKIRFPWIANQFYFHYYPRLKKILRDFQPDIVDLWEEPWSVVSAHACWLRNRLLPNCHIITETEQNICKKLPPPFEQFRSYTLRNAIHAVGRNEEAIEVLRRKGYLGKATVIPNAVDAALFRPMDKPACRAKAGVNGFVLGYAGRMIEEKGLEDLLRALPLTPPHVNLLLIGDGPFRPTLEALAKTLHIENRVKFLPGVPLEQLPPLFNALDCFVLPSRTTPRWKEQFGRVIIEAHACAVPVIGSNSGAIPEVIGIAGLVVPEKQPQALAQAITTLASDPELASQMGRNGRDQVEQKYTWQRVAERMTEIYRSVSSLAPR